MRNLKRVLSLALAAMMLIAAGYNDFTDKDEIVHTEAVQVLNALGVIDGKEDGSFFDPTGNVTRAEMAKMITIICLGNVDVSAFQGTATDLTDISTNWAEAYIKYCYSQGIIAGRGDNTFDPTANVTAVEAAKMLLVAIGYNSKVQVYEGNSWAINVTRDAQLSGFFDDLSVTSTKELTRDEAAQMIYNAVDAYLIEKHSSIDREDGSISDSYIASDTKTLLTETFDVTTTETVMTAVSYDNDEAEYTYTLGAAINGSVDVDSTSDYSSLYGMNVKVLWTTNKAGDTVVYGIYANKSKVMAECVVGDLDFDNIGSNKLKVGSTEYKTEGTTAAMFIEYNDSDLTAVAEPTAQYYSAKLIDLDNNNKVDFIVYYPVEIAKVTYVGKTTISVDTTYGAANLDVDDDTIYDGIAKDDYIVIADGLDGNKVVTKLDSTVSGEVTKIESYEDGFATKLVVDGTTYKINDTAKDDVVSGNLGKDLKAVAYNGYLFYTDDEGAAIGTDEFAVVIEAQKEASFGNKYAQAILLLTSGEEVTVSIDDATAEDEFAKGDLVTYSVDDDVYTLTAANKTSVADYDFDDVMLGETYDKSEGKIGSAYISDNAVIYVKNSDNDWMIISGADLKTKGDKDVDVAYTVKDSSTGYYYVALAQIDDTVSVSNTNYGYITSGISNVKTDDGVVAQFTLWNGSESVVVTTTDKAADLTLAKGDVISYSDLGDGVIDVDGTTAVALTEAGVLAYDGDKNIQFTGGEAEDGMVTIGTRKNAEITDDTVILYIDSDDVAGVEGGSIRLATETVTDDTYYTNVAYELNEDDEVTILVVEVNNNYSNVNM